MFNHSPLDASLAENEFNLSINNAFGDFLGQEVKEGILIDSQRLKKCMEIYSKQINLLSEKNYENMVLGLFSLIKILKTNSNQLINSVNIELILTSLAVLEKSSVFLSDFNKLFIFEISETFIEFCNQIQNLPKSLYSVKQFAQKIRLDLINQRLTFLAKNYEDKIKGLADLTLTNFKIALKTDNLKAAQQFQKKLIGLSPGTVEEIFIEDFIDDIRNLISEYKTEKNLIELLNDLKYSELLKDCLEANLQVYVNLKEKKDRMLIKNFLTFCSVAIIKKELTSPEEIKVRDALLAKGIKPTVDFEDYLSAYEKSSEWHAKTPIKPDTEEILEDFFNRHILFAEAQNNCQFLQEKVKELVAKDMITFFNENGFEKISFDNEDVITILIPPYISINALMEDLHSHFDLCFYNHKTNELIIEDILNLDFQLLKSLFIKHIEFKRDVAEKKLEIECKEEVQTRLDIADLKPLKETDETDLLEPLEDHNYFNQSYNLGISATKKEPYYNYKKDKKIPTTNLKKYNYTSKTTIHTETSTDVLIENLSSDKEPQQLLDWQMKRKVYCLIVSFLPKDKQNFYLVIHPDLLSYLNKKERKELVSLCDRALLLEKLRGGRGFKIFNAPNVSKKEKMNSKKTNKKNNNKNSEKSAEQKTLSTSLVSESNAGFFALHDNESKNGLKPKRATIFEFSGKGKTPSNDIRYYFKPYITKEFKTKDETTETFILFEITGYGFHKNNSVMTFPLGINSLSPPIEKGIMHKV